MLSRSGETPAAVFHSTAASADQRSQRELAERERRIADLEHALEQTSCSLAAADAERAALRHIADLAATFLSAGSPAISGQAFLELRRAVAERQAAEHDQSPRR